MSEDAKVIRLTEMRKLLDETSYAKRQEEIESLYALLIEENRNDRSGEGDWRVKKHLLGLLYGKLEVH